MSNSASIPGSSPATINVGMLSQLAISALERTAFVMAEPAEVDAANAGTLQFATRVCFTGAAAGECLIAASEGFIRELAAGFLAIDPSEVNTAEQGQDALNELANIIAGMVIRELGNQTNRIFLGLPTCIAATTAPATLAAPDAIAAGLDSCGESLVVCVRLQRAVASAA